MCDRICFLTFCYDSPVVLACRQAGMPCVMGVHPYILFLTRHPQSGSLQVPGQPLARRSEPARQDLGNHGLGWCVPRSANYPRHSIKSLIYIRCRPRCLRLQLAPQ
jgi:hypothetical protein